MLQPAGFSQLNHLADSLIHCSFFSASSTNMKELERVHKGNAWQIAGIALVLPHAKQKSFLPLRRTNLHQAASDL